LDGKIVGVAKGNKTGRTFAAAMELAKSGRFKTVAEMADALGRKAERQPPEVSKVIRDVIDGTCFHVRQAKHWDT
jgi:hypothetical protein